MTKTSENSLFDENVDSLFKVEQPADILGKKVRYLRPGLSQSGLFLNFIIDSFAPYLFTQKNIESMNRDDLFEKVIEFVQEKTKGEDEESNRIIGSAFSSKAALDYLYPLLGQCFPDLDPFRVTNDALLECFNKVFTDFFEKSNIT